MYEMVLLLLLDVSIFWNFYYDKTLNSFCIELFKGCSFCISQECLFDDNLIKVFFLGAFRMHDRLSPSDSRVIFSLWDVN